MLIQSLPLAGRPIAVARRQSDARAAALDRLLSPRIYPRHRQRMEEILQPLPTGLLQAVTDQGLRIKLKKPTAESMGPGVRVVGEYNPLTRNIRFAPATLFGPDGDRTVLHEMWHAIDHMRGDRASRIGSVPIVRGLRVLSGAAAESASDRDLLRLYHGYLARYNVVEAEALRMEVDPRKGDKQKFTYTDNWGSRKITYEKRNGVETFHLQPKKRLKDLLPAALITTAAVLNGPIGIAAAAATVLGLQLLARASGNLEKIDPKSHLAVPMQGGAVAQVTQQMHKATVVMPAIANSRPIPNNFSEYAYRSGNIEEYAAEGFSSYLVGGSRARRLQQADPGLYAYVERHLQDEFARY